MMMRFPAPVDFRRPAVFPLPAAMEEAMRVLDGSWTMAAPTRISHRLATRPGEMTAIVATALLSIGLLALPVASAADSDPSTSGEITSHSALPGGERDPLFDEELELHLDSQPSGFPDPWERTNRGVLGFNDLTDRYLIDPITMIYGFVFPGPVKNAIRRVFDNVDEPSTMLNDMLQLEWKDAMTSGSRFVVNTTVGIGGLFDPASRWGIELHNSDFDQTLALAGTPSGPYVVLPFVGPNTVRGGVSYAVDLFMRPSFYVIYMVGPLSLLFYEGSSGLTTREEHLEELKALRESSIDYYAALRNAYYQTRMAQIWDRREDRRPEAVTAGSE
jgi:phospholipid-binding lipoprotein MlaA